MFAAAALIGTEGTTHKGDRSLSGSTGRGALLKSGNGRLSDHGKMVEVKSGRAQDSFPGLGAFGPAYPRARKLLVGGDRIAVEEFPERPGEHWVAP
jgi:hypothetical protein